VTEPRSRTLGVVLFPYFETLDVFGPLQMFGSAADRFDIVTVAEQTGPVASTQGQSVVVDRDLEGCPPLDLLLIPGGLGTRQQVNSPGLLRWLGERASDSELVMTVCTGAALLARTGLLDGRRATTNKRAFSWVAEQGPRVQWVKKARWVEDGKFVTSAGVSAGIDMALAAIARLAGEQLSEELAAHAEYTRQDDPADDPFAEMNGLI